MQTTVLSDLDIPVPLCRHVPKFHLELESAQLSLCDFSPAPEPRNRFAPCTTLPACQWTDRLAREHLVTTAAEGSWRRKLPLVAFTRAISNCLKFGPRIWQRLPFTTRN